MFQKLVWRVKQLVASCGRITSTALQPPVWDVVSDQDHAPSYAHRSGASACLLRCLSSPTLSTNRLDRQPCQRQAYDPWGRASGDARSTADSPSVNQEQRNTLKTEATMRHAPIRPARRHARRDASAAYENGTAVAGRLPQAAVRQLRRCLHFLVYICMHITDQC